jgi:hypothetical protein
VCVENDKINTPATVEISFHRKVTTELNVYFTCTKHLDATMDDAMESAEYQILWCSPVTQE